MISRMRECGLVLDWLGEAPPVSKLCPEHRRNPEPAFSEPGD